MHRIPRTLSPAARCPMRQVRCHRRARSIGSLPVKPGTPAGPPTCRSPSAPNTFALCYNRNLARRLRDRRTARARLVCEGVCACVCVRARAGMPACGFARAREYVCVQVVAARHRKSGKMFAIKIMDKAHIVHAQTNTHTQHTHTHTHTHTRTVHSNARP
jgi:hypothetical protein